jgi:hypothetical protein
VPPVQSPFSLAEVAQLVEHATENRGVASSILALGTVADCLSYNLKTAGVAQLVEHLLAKEKVTGSSPVARSEKKRAERLSFARYNFPLLMETWPSGKARVCKTLTTGSNPVVASFYKDDYASRLFAFS